MRSVGAFEDKTNLSRLLNDVAHGETIAITKHGVPVALLVPPASREKPAPEEAIAALRAFRTRLSPLGNDSIRDLIEAGRRY